MGLLLIVSGEGYDTVTCPRFINLDDELSDKGLVWEIIDGKFPGYLKCFRSSAMDTPSSDAVIERVWVRSGGTNRCEVIPTLFAIEDKTSGYMRSSVSDAFMSGKLAKVSPSVTDSIMVGLRHLLLSRLDPRGGQRRGRRATSRDR